MEYFITEIYEVGDLIPVVISKGFHRHTILVRPLLEVARGKGHFHPIHDGRDIGDDGIIHPELELESIARRQAGEVQRGRREAHHPDEIRRVIV